MRVRPFVFWPPFLLVLVSLALNFWDRERFLAGVNGTNAFLLTHLSPLFAWVGLLCLVACVWTAFSPLGRTTLGGVGAKPLLNFRSWAFVALCTNTAAGILFWSMAEPLYHLSGPPAALGIGPHSPEARQFALATLFFHWSFTPAALYALPGLVFALVFYNRGQPFSLASCLEPLLGPRARQFSIPLDAIALFALVLGMGASLDTGILTLAGGVDHLSHWESGPPLWTALGALVVGAFVLSALSGLGKGIRLLSHVNSWLFLAIGAYILLFGYPWVVTQLGLEGLAELGRTFLKKSLFVGFASDDPWPRQWTVFYWAVWLAWCPVAAAFLGRIARGYTVRQFLLVNLVIPATFAIFWTGLFGSTALHLESQGAGLVELMNQKGPEAVMYGVFSRIPGGGVIIPCFLLLVFLSYVTAADSNCVAMAGMSTEGLSPEQTEPPVRIKLAWGALVGVMGVTMLNLGGVEGIRALSYLGGVPALFFEFAVLGSLAVLHFQSRKQYHRKPGNEVDRE